MSSHFNTYTVLLSGTKKVGKGTFNVAATIGGKDIADWSFFDACECYSFSKSQSTENMDSRRYQAQRDLLKSFQIILLRISFHI